MTKCEYFTDDEIKETLLNNLDEYEGIEDYTFDDVFNDLFNSDYYIIGYKEAVDALEEYGIFNALEEVQRWDEDNFGHWETDYTNTEAVANMLEYIHASEYMNDMLDRAGLDMSDETTPENVNKLIKTLKEY
ncbi:hypothetical protein [Lactobacillus taiwanensis]|uniref:Uncharacterized protein n=1 Tax=Lactobacillus taiwanensis TaxID=508451 RepID=A0A256LEH4_9LACO|nr:hypothetical protein [Lactobacillus taiwanensis]OYR87346.1 hypothetical protein CBF53_07810 [Lactobacillus taiwanensis]OYR90967.1 hypothetical protein CBF70_07255 [Lactobacillus taiwanensis]OYR91873.1 hypothetical protein CBF59_05040 [Lactobacillus taiwanensis]